MTNRRPAPSRSVASRSLSQSLSSPAVDLLQAVSAGVSVKAAGAAAAALLPKAGPAPRRRPSIVDVAALAGVSAGTVSRALSRPDMVNETTRGRVLAAAERLGYVANGAARALVERRTGTIGALIPRYGPSSFPMMVQGLENTLAEHGYTMLLSAPDHRRARDPAILRSLLERGVDAVVLLGSDHPPSFHTLLQVHQTPFVMVWAERPEEAGAGGADWPCVGYDERAAAALVIDHLAALGHRRVGILSGRIDDNARARRRLHGLIGAIARHGIVLDPAATVYTDYGFREGFDAMREILARRARVSALICGNDYLAAGALAALDQAAVAVPQALSIASFNDNDFAAYLHPPLTTVRTPIRLMGEHAARLLIEMLRGPHTASPPAADEGQWTGLAARLLPIELVVRGSTGPAAISPADRRPGSRDRAARAPR